MRTGPELVRASNVYARENRALTWRLLATTLLVLGANFAAIVLVPWPLAQVALAVLAGLVSVRLFIFYHDYLHGALFAGSRVGGWFMRAAGFWVLAGPSVWKETHDYHHKHTAKMPGASIGSFPVVTLGIWKVLTPKERFAYRAARHPLTMASGYLTLFIFGMCLAAFRRQPVVHRDGLYALLIHIALVLGVGFLGGPWIALLTVVIPVAVATGVGSYLFYAQHNFPDMQLRGRREWEYTFAALRSSSMFDMNPVMHWLTGNIGYHHVHHLNHRIPFYRLPEAMAEMPELQNPGRTTWHPRDVWGCLKGNIWDPKRGRMITYAEADATPIDDGAVAAK